MQIIIKNENTLLASQLGNISINDIKESKFNEETVVGEEVWKYNIGSQS